MPRFNVEVDGKWACFSTVSDEFITPFMPLEEYEKWRSEQYGLQKEPLETANRMSLARALWDMSIYRSDKHIMDNLRFAGLMEKVDLSE